MSEKQISDDFKDLGNNLADLLRAAWDHPQRARVQHEIEDGLQELGDALSRAVDEVSQSDLGRKVQADLAGIKEKVEKGEVEERVRTDIRSALGTINAELSSLIQKLRDHA